MDHRLPVVDDNNDTAPLPFLIDWNYYLRFFGVMVLFLVCSELFRCNLDFLCCVYGDWRDVDAIIEALDNPLVYTVVNGICIDIISKVDFFLVRFWYSLNQLVHFALS